jgi:endonuclease/exonuclease/phosphatase family metal-dependent hydrolase
MRIATWNVERPKPNGWKVPPAQLRRMAEVDADIWVLTETHVDHQPTPDHTYSAFCPPHDARRPTDERWTAIWSKWPLHPIDDPAPHRRGTVAAIVGAPVGPLLVYGTVISWANEPNFDDGREARMWEAHMAEIARQGGEWARLRAMHPGVPMVVAGDFNQDRDGSGWYGTHAGRSALGTALLDAGLVCVTRFDVVEAGLLESDHLVDHICVTNDLATNAVVRCWERIDSSGQRLSDHPTVAVDIAGW